MQMRIPRFTLSHVGSGAPQSQHLSLPGRLRILVTILWREGGGGVIENSHVVKYTTLSVNYDNVNIMIRKRCVCDVP